MHRWRAYSAVWPRPRLALSGEPRRSSTLPHTSGHAPIPKTTIYAPATPAGKSAISIVRISGPDAHRVWPLVRKRNALEPSKWPPNPRRALLREIWSAESAGKLDEGIVLYFPGETSLTGQDLLELHLHGSTAIMKAVLASLSRLPGFRPAEAGEFTRLAFDNGRMDLTEVEGLRDLIDSETEAQRRLAITQADGHMRHAYDAMRADIIGAMSSLEALIDFGEDEGIGESVYAPARQQIVLLRERIERQLEVAQRAEIVRNGVRLAIFGAPNAGKSSFLNWLAQREASIVTAHPGTTRDVVEVSLDFRGYPLIVCDTAGLRRTNDEVESIGIERARAMVERADLKICIVSLSEMPSSDGPHGILDPMTVSLADRQTIFILNKVDLCHSGTSQEPSKITAAREQLASFTTPDNIVVVSVKDGRNLDHVVRLLLESLEAKLGSTLAGEEVLITQERHRIHLQDCLQCLDTFLDTDPQLDLVGAAEELRYAAQALGKVTGHVRVDDVLDRLFSSFCIGK